MSHSHVVHVETEETNSDESSVGEEDEEEAEVEVAPPPNKLRKTHSDVDKKHARKLFECIRYIQEATMTDLQDIKAATTKRMHELAREYNRNAMSLIREGDTVRFPIKNKEMIGKVQKLCQTRVKVKVMDGDKEHVYHVQASLCVVLN
jgi:hypothetical protein